MTIPGFNRRKFLGQATIVPLAAATSASAQEAGSHAGHGAAAHDGNNMVMGEVDHVKNGFDPHKILTDFDAGTVSTDTQGRRVREWTVTAIDHEFEVAPGITFAGWTY